MNSIELLLTRQSNGQLISPAPDKIALDTILKAGMRVPDHGGLTPWHFCIVNENRLNTLSEIFEQAAMRADLNETKIAKAAKMPYRAPLIIIVSTKIVEHEKVPKQEQIITASACVHAMQMAAFALGYGAMWRTGSFAYNNDVKQQLSISLRDEIVGFLYIGTQGKKFHKKQSKNYHDFVSYL